MSRRLSGLDAAFLALETPTSTGHVGSVSILDPATAPEPLDLARVTRLYETRIGRIPVLRQHLMSIPFGIDQPVWVDDEHFDIGYHVRELALPSPGSRDQLAEQVARIHARPLDRARPLWEVYVISGLERDLVAVYTKVHHAAIDGVSGAEMLTALFDLTPTPPDEPAHEPWRPSPPPNRAWLGVEAAARLIVRPFEATKLLTEALRVVPSAVPALAPVVGEILGPVAASVLGVGRGIADGSVIDPGTPLVAPRTPFNVDISPHRRFAYGTLSLEEVKAVKNHFGTSVNDVVIALCAGALRRWLIAHDALPEGPLVAMIPVSIRTSTPDFEGNQVSAMLAGVPTHLSDPVQRLRTAQAVTQVAKAQQAAIPQGLVDDVTDFAPPAFTTRVARMIFASHVLNRIPAFNTVISNVPGPPIPVYLAGAKLLAHYPVSVVSDGMGLNITLVGYNGGLHFGIIAAREIAPDLDDLVTHLHTELDLLLAAVATRPAVRRRQRRT